MVSSLKPKTISQAKMARFQELKPLVKEFDELKKEIVAMAEAGLPCAPGQLVCSVDIQLTTNVPWKTEFIQHLGQTTADEVLKKYEKKAKRKSLVVVDRSNPLGK